MCFAMSLPVSSLIESRLSSVSLGLVTLPLFLPVFEMFHSSGCHPMVRRYFLICASERRLIFSKPTRVNGPPISQLNLPSPVSLFTTPPAGCCSSSGHHASSLLLHLPLLRNGLVTW